MIHLTHGIESDACISTWLLLKTTKKRVTKTTEATTEAPMGKRKKTQDNCDTRWGGGGVGAE